MDIYEELFFLYLLNRGQVYSTGFSTTVSSFLISDEAKYAISTQSIRKMEARNQVTFVSILEVPLALNILLDEPPLANRELPPSFFCISTIPIKKRVTKMWINNKIPIIGISPYLPVRTIIITDPSSFGRVSSFAKSEQKSRTF